MTVAELMQSLLAMPQDAEVLMEDEPTETPSLRQEQWVDTSVEVRPGIFGIARNRVWL